VGRFGGAVEDHSGHWNDVGLGDRFSTLRAIHGMIHTSLESCLSWLHGTHRALCN